MPDLSDRVISITGVEDDGWEVFNLAREMKLNGAFPSSIELRLAVKTAGNCDRVYSFSFAFLAGRRLPTHLQQGGWASMA